MRIKLFTIPNIITCLNLLSGCMAIAAAFNHDFLCAFIFIVAAAIFDFLDGFLARLLKSFSGIGKDLDSLADVVSFGVAPAIMMFCILKPLPNAGNEIFIVFILAAFSALRLAKFNVDTRQTSEFIGLPTPANGILISSLVYLASQGSFYNIIILNKWAAIGLSVILSILLVSEIRMFSFKFKDFSLKNNIIRYLFMGISAMLIAIYKLESVPAIILIYIIMSIIRNMVCRKGTGAENTDK